VRCFGVAAPARLAGCVGAILFMALAAGCDRIVPDSADAGPRVIELAHDTIRLADGVTLVDIAVRRSEQGDFEPAAAEARSGDVIRFTAKDRGGHAVVFEGHALDPAIREYLDRTGQLRGPPLIAEDAAWVITLDGAPPGVYRFRCATHDAAGSITVR
jgi:plastocyanin